MKIDPQQIVSIIDGRAAELEILDNDIVMETVGVAMALGKLRESLDEVDECLNNREFEKASHIGYQDVAHNFVYLQRTLAGLQAVTQEKSAFISAIAMAANAAYEDVEPYVEKRMSSSVPRHQRPAQEVEGDCAATDGDMELIHGSGNVFADFGHPNAGLEQARAIIAAKIIGILDDRKLSLRDAETITGVHHTEFSRIRNTQLGRFTLDRMIAILGKLDQDVDIVVRDKLHDQPAAHLRVATSYAELPHFSLSAEQWEAFIAALDAPPSENPKLHELMATKAPWEE